MALSHLCSELARGRFAKSGMIMISIHIYISSLPEYMGLHGLTIHCCTKTVYAFFTKQRGGCPILEPVGADDIRKCLQHGLLHGELSRRISKSK